MFDVKSYLKLGRRLRPTLRFRSLMHAVSYLLVFTAVISFAASMVFNASSPVGTITSESMTPILGVGDIVFVQPSRLEDVQIGDIVAFQATPQTSVIHRVEKKMYLPGKIYLITKGDANDVTDQSVGIPPVRDVNFLGKVLCVDGVPMKIPLIGQVWLHLYNFSIWLTQDKPWSFWAPVLSSLYICWPAVSGGKKIYQKHLARRRINKKQIFVVAFAAFTAISLFTLWFRVEQYSLGLRVACLLDFKEKPNFNYGSMIYGQKQDNAISVTGAPMFPVKAVSVVKGNASLLSSVIPNSTIIEANTYMDLNLHTEVPARGEITPGLYEGVVYVFSSSLWTLLPNEVIFRVFNSLPTPWGSAVLLELFGAFILASSITIFFISMEFLVKQIVYTQVWLRKRPEERRVPRYLLLIKNAHLKARCSVESIKTRVGTTVNKFSIGGKIRGFRVFLAIAVTSYLAYFAVGSFFVSVTLQCLLSGAYAIHRRLRQREALIGVVFEHIVYCCILTVNNAVSSLYNVKGVWSLPSSGFAGILFLVVTTPVVFSLFLLAFRTLVLLKVWGLEQETMWWAALRRVKFVLPTFERVAVEVIPRKIDLWRYHITRKITAFVEPRILTAESCKVIKPLEVDQKTPGKLDVERYAPHPKELEKLESSPGKRTLTVEEYWVNRAANLSSLKGGNL